MGEGCLADPNMMLSEDCRDLSFWVYSVGLCSTNHAKYDNSPKISDSCTGNIFNHFLFCFIDQNVTLS